MLRDEIVYRPGVPADAGELAAFGSESFVDAYGSSSPREAVARHVRQTYSADLQRAELQDPHCWTIVGDRSGEIVAAALLGLRPPPLPVEAGADWVEIKRFYVGRIYWKTGVSTDLMVAALQSARDRGGREIWLQVWAEAAQAIGFYRKWGFVVSGKAPFLLGSLPQEDLVMTRSLVTS